jgi:hypothetical protein
MKTKIHNPWGTEHNMDPNCGWAVPKRFLGTARHMLVGQMGSQGKKEADNTFVLPAIRTLLVILTSSHWD